MCCMTWQPARAYWVHRQVQRSTWHLRGLGRHQAGMRCLPCQPEEVLVSCKQLLCSGWRCGEVLGRGLPGVCARQPLHGGVQQWGAGEQAGSLAGLMD